MDILVMYWTNKYTYFCSGKKKKNPEEKHWLKGVNTIKE